MDVDAADDFFEEAEVGNEVICPKSSRDWPYYCELGQRGGGVPFQRARRRLRTFSRSVVNWVTQVTESRA